MNETKNGGKMEIVTFDLVFDNGGGILLQTADYCHFYNGREDEAAEAVALLLQGETPDTWDGNEPEHRLEYDHDTERNGGYRWHILEDVTSVLDLQADDFNDYIDNAGSAEGEFYKFLASKLNKLSSEG